MAPLRAGILIGGRSARMGCDKAALEIGGVSLTRRIADVLRHFVPRIVLIGQTSVPEDARGLERIVEDTPGDGPSAAILAAHAVTPDCAWLIVACDMPRVSVDAISWLIAQRDAARSAVFPALEVGVLQPMLAIYEPSGLCALRELYQAGVRSPRKLAAHPRVATPTVPNELRDAWRNVNTPEEWHAL